MTTPQRPLRPLLPNVEGRPISQTAPKRKIKIACKPCSQKKCRCDGIRPICSTCEGLSIECSYGVAEGQSRYKSLKLKHEALQRDLGSTLELIWHLQHAPDTDAQAIFSGLREGVDPSDVVAAVNNSKARAPQQEPSITSATAAQFNALQPYTHQRADLTTSHDVTGILDLSDSARLAATLRSQSDVLMEAFATFMQCTSTIFHIYTHEEVDALLTESLHTDGPVPLSTLCETCGIAAVGSRFSRAKITPQMGEYYFSMTKQLLDECIEKTPLQAMKVCALLAMCNIINKATAAFAYVELGLGVARLIGLQEREPHSCMDDETWKEGKKVAKSLLLCRGWLQTTLSYVPETEAPVSIDDVLDEDDCCPDFEDHTLYQTQVARLTVIKAGIFKRMGTSDFSPESGEAIRLSLKQWLDQIPEQIRLDNLDRHSVSPEARISGLYLHSFYLGGRMLVYRWILSWIVNVRRAGRDLPSETKVEAARCAEEGVLAAKESATTLFTIYQESGAVRHCWLCIFQAYLSCCVLLYDVLQRVLHGKPTVHLNNLKLASFSLDVLSWAGQLDVTGKQYHATLKPIYTLASSLSMREGVPTSMPEDDHVHFREIIGTSAVHDATHKLSQLLYVALKSGQERGKSASSYRPEMAETVTSLDGVGLGLNLYWAMEFEADGTRLENADVFRTSSAPTSIMPTLRGQFAGEGQTCGWTTSRSFIDPVLIEASTTADVIGMPQW